MVIAVDGVPVNDNNDLSRYIASKAPGTTVKLQVIRGGAERTTVTDDRSTASRIERPMRCQSDICVSRCECSTRRNRVSRIQRWIAPCVTEQERAARSIP